ncbi:MAG TPA: DUF1844 domain-containing protein [Desulfomonilaceae bacterium]|nr:DUF1844 domain-containing protein [Desulfomonilaceae bacterium]HVN81684.1 DUF1844 domain-containing protein [Terriglobia bacterium]
MEDPGQEPEFKITDKRRFTSEGETKEKRPDQEQEAAAEQPSAAGVERGQEEKEESPRPLDFSSFVLSLANTALFQLGLIKLPNAGEPKKDLKGARQTIDLLALIEEKTRGNLTEQEEKILKETLFQLRMVFVESSK